MRFLPSLFLQTYLHSKPTPPNHIWIQTSPETLPMRASHARHVWPPKKSSWAGLYISNVSTFLMLLLLFSTLICMIRMKLNRIGDALSRTTMVLFLCRNRSPRNG
uniref:Predicted protein n=1 Tax=Hordeum vulgare subsp. vulgare TaxID=112509 RepID=F2E3I6_HORVV|nr:predicted protein [Hordeum vulgare subsp. vulgare]